MLKNFQGNSDLSLIYNIDLVAGCRVFNFIRMEIYMKIRLKSFQEGLLFVLFAIMPFVDMYTGYFQNMRMHGFQTQIGQLYRVIFFVVMLYYVYQKFITSHPFLFVFTCYAFCIPVIYALRHKNIDGLTEDYSYILKVFMPLYIIYAIYDLSSRNLIKINFVDNVLEFWSWVYPLSLIIPRFLNLGFYHYFGNGGYKGFYYTTNDLNILLAVLYIFSFNKLSQNKNVRNAFKLLMMLVAVIFLGSKTSIIVLVVVTGVFIVKGINYRQFVEYLFASVIIVLMIGLAVYNLFEAQINAIFVRLRYFYAYYTGGKGGFLTFLMSERNLRISPAFKYWYGGKNAVFNFLFGVGKYQKCPNSSNIGKNAFSLIEIDFFDILFWFGSIFLVILVCYFIHFFVKYAKRTDEFEYKVMFIFIMLFSFFAGHIFISAMGGTMLGIVCARLKMDDNILNSRNGILCDTYQKD